MNVIICSGTGRQRVVYHFASMRAVLQLIVNDGHQDERISRPVGTSRRFKSSLGDIILLNEENGGIE
jgi:hypothetical protein